MSVISNTTVISNFASINQLDLLRRLFGALYISTEVYEEIRIGLEEGYQFYAGIDQMIHPFVHDGWIRLTSMADQAEIALYGELPSRLHRGEASRLVIARHRGWMLLTDDRAARDEGNRLGIMVSGSVGCLVLAVERGLWTLEQAHVWLGEMIRLGYRSPVNHHYAWREPILLLAGLLDTRHLNDLVRRHARPQLLCA
jgi:predicted nucleic acid-binding protein